MNANARSYSFDTFRAFVGYDISITEVAKRSGISRRSLTRAVHEGLTETAADQLAIRFHRHPCEIWGVDWWSNCPTPRT